MLIKRPLALTPVHKERVRESEHAGQKERESDAEDVEGKRDLCSLKVSLPKKVVSAEILCRAAGFLDGAWALFFSTEFFYFIYFIFGR